jgi:protein phosphatase
MLSYRAFGATDIGLVRFNNEDAFLVKMDTGLLALADGMGGPPAGEVASAIFVQAADEVSGLQAPASAGAACALIKDAFRLARRRMVEHVARYPDHAGMGCTAELLVFAGDRYLLGHLGDSRVYLLRGGEFRQLTRDHSLVQQMMEQGIISRAEARHHAMKNVLLRTLGADLEPSFDLIRGRSFSEDLFLLCSDGLTEKLDDSAIQEILASRTTLPEKVELLIAGAKSAGGSDNVTVVLCRADGAASSTVPI